MQTAAPRTLALFPTFPRILSNFHPDLSAPRSIATIPCETATLAWTLSIGHPPGYPFHTLLAHVFSLLPLGDPGLRVSLFAAFLGALCAALVFWACDSRPRGLVAACLLCLGPVFWHNAGTAKGSVYMLNNVLSLACLWAAGSQRQRFFWVLLGLGLANHYMSQLVLLPCYLLLMREAGWRKAWGGAWLALPGISLYLYLPLRAAQDPAINWSHIQSLGGFIFYFLRAQYAAGEFSRAAGTSLGQLVAAVKDILMEGHGIASLLAFYALWQAWLARDSRRLALALGAAMALLAVALYLNLSKSRLDLMQPYLFPAYLCVALLAASALGAGMESAGEPSAVAGPGRSCPQPRAGAARISRITILPRDSASQHPGQPSARRGAFSPRATR